jgi:hypothetical protein
MVMAKGMLSAVMAKATCGWLWHSDKIVNRMGVVPIGCLSEFVGKKAKGMTDSMVCAIVVTALCG